ncbi:Similar to S.cerevisiae protein RPL9A (Ribosomal 60S subunit protein L9A) [Malassezia sympodialis ATCC 42132]|uniref:Similar to S.cerevisiae protein RPL9A (Ribosomal 60S subunit protein L9A) n=1 Tax=Malassezia sympodialis (strain ATCC 42132) TaxID=1230383 RepID=A0A1M8A0Z2_MALS4|nr:Similar to S.cerevisiae protein RPL9A (Ribosomal 60S subunit protein L9A) [Malassezia sympodialis ATCC 42132]
MLTIYKDLDLDIPENVTVQIDSRIITVKGPRGELQKNLRHMAMDIRLVTGPKGSKLKFIVWHGGRKHLACLRTAKAAVANMIKGVTVGFQYKMRAVYAHFPINLIIAGDKKSVEIRNFLGEKRVRKVVMQEGVTITDDKAQKDQVLVEGNDIDAVSQSAALLHGVTLVRNKDIRKFLDGIYCTAKTSIVQVEA